MSANHNPVVCIIVPTITSFDNISIENPESPSSRSPLNRSPRNGEMFDTPTSGAFYNHSSTDFNNPYAAMSGSSKAHDVFVNNPGPVVEHLPSSSFYRGFEC